jgi:hypothetical protein
MSTRLIGQKYLSEKEPAFVAQINQSEVFTFGISHMN